VESYTDTVRRYIVPAIGRVALAKLEPGHIQRMLAGLTARGDLSPTTVRYTNTVLRIALGRALKAGKVIRNAATLVDPPAKARLELRPLSADEVGAFLESIADTRDAPLYTVAIGTGMRQGELLGLRWSDVDLEAGTLTVRHSLDRRTFELAEPKTDFARRTLRLGGEVGAALRSQRRRQLEERVAAGSRWQERDLVFASPIGAPLDHAVVRRRLQAALAEAGLPRQRFHDLRHAFATLSLEQGEELGVVSKMLGHSNISTTADVYAHLTPAMAQRAADRLDVVLRRRPTAV
jgi:integrase